MRRLALVMAILALPTFPLAVAEGDTKCVPGSEASLPLGGGHYARTHADLLGPGAGTSVEIWREGNGADGLQTIRHRCANGAVIPPDALVVRACGPDGSTRILCLVDLTL